MCFLLCLHLKQAINGGSVKCELSAGTDKYTEYQEGLEQEIQELETQVQRGSYHIVMD